jgi:predicted tellurium resistance membrane protein TerC
VLGIDNVVFISILVEKLPLAQRERARQIGLFMAMLMRIGLLLVLSFLVVIGVVLIAEGFDQHEPKGYVYFAMAFSVGVEMLNIRMRKRSKKPAELHAAYVAENKPPH